MIAKPNTRPEPLQVDLESAALVIVDMQNAFLAKGGVFDLAGVDISQMSKVTGVIKKILEEARSAGLKIVYLQMGYKEDLRNSGGPDSPNWHKEFALLLMRNRPDLKVKRPLL